jgi:hypothetical protein
LAQTFLHHQNQPLQSAHSFPYQVEFLSSVKKFIPKDWERLRIDEYHLN